MIWGKNSVVHGRSSATKRKEKIAHIRFSAADFGALEEVARAAGMTVSAFVRALSMEGAGVHPFFGEADRAVLGLLAEGMRTIGGNLNQVARAINIGRVPADDELAGSIKDAHVIATTVASELAEMTRRAAARRRWDGA